MKLKANDEHQISSISDLINIVQKAYAKVIRSSSFSALFIGAGIIAFGIALTIILEHYFFISSVFKSLLLFFFFCVGSICGWKIFKKISQSSFNSFYRYFADWSSIESIRNAIDLNRSERSGSPALRKAAINQNIKDLSDKDLLQKLSAYTNQRSEIKAFKNSLLGFFLAIVLLTGLSFTTPDALNRSLHFWNSYQPPNPYSYTIEPGNVTLEQGSAFKPRINFDGPLPEKLSLSFKTTVEKSYRSRPGKFSNNKTATFASLTPTTGGSYFLEMDGFKSKIFTVDVQLLPRFTALSLIVMPPSYTSLDKTEYVYPFSTIKALRGSEITLTGIANKELNALRIIQKSLNDTSKITLQNARSFDYTLTVTKADTILFKMEDTAGLTNKNSFEFVVSPESDESPFVEIIEPESDIQMQNPRDMQVSYKASDDFGLLSTALHYSIKRAFIDEPVKGVKSLKIPALNASENFLWKIKELHTKPRDVISYWIEVADNDAINGSKKARSRTLTITFPSMVSYMDDLEQRERNVENDLNKVSDSFEEMKQEYDRFKKQLKENPEGNWEQQQSLEEVKKKGQEIDDKVQELSKQFDDVRKEMKGSEVMSSETLKAYDELQKLVQEIDDPELQKALEALQNSMGKLNQQQMREAIKNFEFNQQQYQNRIKRTLELFKKIKLNSDLEKLAASFEELAKQERELAESNNLNEEESKKQKAIQKDTDKLSEDVKKLSDSGPDDSKEQVKKLQQQTKQQIDTTRQELQDNLQKLQKNSGGSKSKNIKQQQQKIQNQFRQIAQNIRDKQQRMAGQQRQINSAALQYILFSLISLSEKQEDLTEETELLAGRSQAFVQKARTQQSIKKQFEQISDSLFKVSSSVPTFSNRINQRKGQVQQQLASAVEQLSERDKSKSIFAERQSLGGINELATMIATLLNQLQNQKPGNGSGQMSMQQMIEQLQKMSGQQQMLNQQMQNLINQMHGDRLTQDQMQRLNQMSRQQNQIRKQLKELQNSGQFGSGDKVLSELERMSEQMEETINDLRGGQTDNLLIKRQQNILSRMLNAEKALQERGKEEKREGTTATDRPAPNPPDVTLEELQKRIRKYLNDPTQTKFTEDYQKLIEQYFRLLRERQKERK